PGSYLGLHDLVIRGKRENGNMLASEDLYAITIHELAHITHIRNGWGDLKITLTTAACARVMPSSLNGILPERGTMGKQFWHHLGVR
ncbi:MAG: hypothetical protein HC842_03290, partial [Cytophagales bacterium]|nr:hypothetical protein [Cytophagales bacterium]